jgi:2-oxoglutarate dehydrogenase complex dehydrogenase (E1) component-like enzyme
MGRMAPLTLKSLISDCLLVNVYADHFERFLSTKFQASKRFGIEGCESLIPGLFALIEVCKISSE